MDAPEVKVGTCTVIISWTTPFGNVPDNYIIEIEGSDGAFYVVPTCGNSSSYTSCSVPVT